MTGDYVLIRIEQPLSLYSIVNVRNNITKQHLENKTVRVAQWLEDKTIYLKFIRKCN